MWGWGAMNPTAIKRAAENGYPMDHFIGIWWSGADDDAARRRPGGQGLSGAQLQRPRLQLPGASRTSRNTSSTRARARSRRTSSRTTSTTAASTTRCSSRKRSATRRRSPARRWSTGEDVRRGLETLNITQARWKELGFPDFGAPVQATCADHNGHAPAYMQQWDGTKWVKVSDWIEPMKDKVRAAARGGRGGLRRRRNRLAEAHRGLRQVVVSLTYVPLPASARGRGPIGVARCPPSRDTTSDDRRLRLPPQAAAHPLGQQHRGHLRSRHPGAQGRVARRAEGRDRGAARRQRRGQDHHAEGDLESAARRARRGHQRLDPVRRRTRCRTSRPTSWCGAAASR